MSDEETDTSTGAARTTAEPDARSAATVTARSSGGAVPAEVADEEGRATRSARHRAAGRHSAPLRRRGSAPASSRPRGGRAHAHADAEARSAARPGVSRGHGQAARRTAFAFAALALIVAVLGFGVWSALFRATAAVPPGRSVTVVIAKGASGDAVATELAKAGVVINATMFRVRAQLMGATADMKAGTYTFTTGSEYEPVIRRLQAGPQTVYVTITIPEGWGIPAIAARVQTDLHVPAATFITLATTGAKMFHYAFLDDDPTDSLEGYLFPKTYRFKVDAGVTATGVIDVMLAQYGKETAGLDFSYAKSKGLTPHNVLTIASIIEREASVASDRPKVSSVIYNRLAIGMRLQLDSTVQFALDGKANLTLADLQTPSPYNTYVHAGLPPGPICDPGLVSIQAALAPATTKYLYYILTYKDGRQSFATDYADFLTLKAQSKKGLR
jgi:UPF0755 protein